MNDVDELQEECENESEDESENESEDEFEYDKEQEEFYIQQDAMHHKFLQFVGQNYFDEGDGIPLTDMMNEYYKQNPAELNRDGLTEWSCSDYFNVVEKSFAYADDGKRWKVVYFIHGISKKNQ